MYLKHHVHVNVHALAPSAAAKFEAIGLIFDPFEPLADSYAPPIHYSLETNDRRLARATWNRALAIMNNDPSFRGYIESETLAEAFTDVDESDRPYSPSKPFPFGRLDLVRVPQEQHKRSDLHVKRPALLNRDELDSRLVSVGFYEVRTARSRIYTLQCEQVDDAREIFYALRDHFREAGGARIVNFEVIGRLQRKPSDFEVAKYLPRQAKSFLAGS